MASKKYENVCCPQCGADLRAPGTVTIHQNVALTGVTSYSAGLGDFTELSLYDPARTGDIGNFHVFDKTCGCRACGSPLHVKDLVPAKKERG